jgi:hypothetical protein
MTKHVGDQSICLASYGPSKRLSVLWIAVCALVITIGGDMNAADPLSVGSYASVTCSILNVRDQPGGHSVAQLPTGWIVRIASGPLQAMLGEVPYTWYQVESSPSTSSVSGWVVSDYLSHVHPDLLNGGFTPVSVLSSQNVISRAILDAQDEEGSIRWYSPSTGMTYCLGFVADMYGVTGSLGWTCPGDEQYSCPKGGLKKLRNSGDFYEAGSSWNPPEGALIFFSNQPLNGVEYGHIGIHLGEARVAHVTPSGPVANDFIADVAARVGGEYLGWAYPPLEWLGQNTETCYLTGTWVGETTYDRVVRNIDADNSEIERLTGRGGIEVQIQADGGSIEGKFRMILDEAEGGWMSFSQVDGNLIDYDSCSFSIEVVVETVQTYTEGLLPVTFEMSGIHSFAFHYDSDNLLVQGLSTVKCDIVSSVATADNLTIMTISFPGLVLKRMGPATP